MYYMYVAVEKLRGVIKKRNTSGRLAKMAAKKKAKKKVAKKKKTTKKKASKKKRA